jgi:hypothetical protein
MALGFMQLAKLMKGDLDSDQLAEMLGSIGLAADISQLKPGQVDPAFKELWESAQESGGVLLRVELSKKNGEKISGLLLMPRAASPLSAAAERDGDHTLAAQVA